MTKENAVKLYKHFCELVENPTGADSVERENVRKKAIKSKENLEEHFRTGKKYQGDEEIQALLNPKKEKEDGKRKRRNESA